LISTGGNSVRPKLQHLIAPIAAIAFIILEFTEVAPAQKAIGAKSGVIQYSQGEVFLDNTPIQLAKDDHVQIENDQVLSTKNGSVELVLAPAAYLWLGKNASLTILQNKLSNILLEINQGSALIEILETIKDYPIKVHVSERIIDIRKAGLYRLNAVPGQLQVFSGEALAKNENQQTRIAKGKMVRLDGKSAPVRFDVKSVDALRQLAIRRSSEITVWMKHSEIEAAMREAIRGLIKDEFQSRMQSQADQEIQRLQDAEWRVQAEQARQEMLRQKEIERQQQQSEQREQ
jgi:hypothetical protein